MESEILNAFFGKRIKSIDIAFYSDHRLTTRLKKHILYNQNGNVIQIVDSTTNNSVKATYKYDSSFNLIEKCLFDSKNYLFARSIYVYDEKSALIKIIEESILNGQSFVYIKLTCNYDINGNKVEKSNFNQDGSLKDKINYQYDDKNNLIAENAAAYIEYKYDESGKVMERIVYKDQKQLLNKLFFKYNDNNQIVEKVLYKYDDTLLNSQHFTYDEMGSIIEEIDLNPNARMLFHKKVTYSYVYNDS